MNFLNALKTETNYTYTGNHALVYKSTMNAVYDMFARCGAMRRASNDDCVLLFKMAYEENPELALKCLFWARAIRQGAGERRFFRVCYHWLAQVDPDAAARNIEFVGELGRYDDLYCLIDTPCEQAMWDFIKNTLANDISIVLKDTTGKKAISLLAKWLKSSNSSSKETQELGKRTAKALGMTAKNYRKTLSKLRKRINVLETLMSENKWEDIDFSGIPSKAGLLYREAFQRHQPERYKEFMMNKNTKVNSSAALYPYEVIGEVLKTDYCNYWDAGELDPVQRETLNKYWECQRDLFEGKTLDAICVVDTSASMVDNRKDAPINVAISLGLYCAERAKGPFHNHYISFSSKPQLIETVGVDFVDKVKRIYETNLCENTNLEATFDLMLDTIVKHNVPKEEQVKSVIIISDCQFDSQVSDVGYDWYRGVARQTGTTLMEHIKEKWDAAGVDFPNLVYWNVNAKKPTFPSKAEDGITYVSGCSPILFDGILSNKTGIEMMTEILNGEAFKDIK